MKGSVFQDNYGKWRANVVDDLGNCLWTGLQHELPEQAELEGVRLSGETPEWGPVSWFRDGTTDATSGAAKLPHVNAELEAARAGLEKTTHAGPSGWPAQPVPAGWKAQEAGSLPEPSADRMAEADPYGVEPLNPVAAQRANVEAVIGGVTP